MHEHEKAYQQNPAQRFYQKHKNPKIKKTKNKKQKPRSKMHEMHEE